jgi:hypothetical protein
VLTSGKVGAFPILAMLTPQRGAPRGSGLLGAFHPLRCARWLRGGVGTRGVPRNSAASGGPNKGRLVRLTTPHG